MKRFKNPLYRAIMHPLSRLLGNGDMVDEIERLEAERKFFRSQMTKQERKEVDAEVKRVWQAKERKRKARRLENSLPQDLSGTNI